MCSRLPHPLPSSHALLIRRTTSAIISALETAGVQGTKIVVISVQQGAQRTKRDSCIRTTMGVRSDDERKSQLSQQVVQNGQLNLVPSRMHRCNMSIFGIKDWRARTPAQASSRAAQIVPEWPMIKGSMGLTSPHWDRDQEKRGHHTVHAGYTGKRQQHSDANFCDYGVLRILFLGLSLLW